jgi:hypothetical protein
VALTADNTKQILKIENDLLNTYIHGDVADRERYAADDFVVVDRDGGVTSKQGDIQDIKSGSFLMQWFRMKNEKVSFLAPDVALLTYDIAYEATNNGVDSSSPQSRVATIYQRREGVWRALYTQETAAKDSQVAADKASRNQSSSDLAMFVAKEKEVWEALKHKDKAAATRLLADDFVGMYDFGFFNKSEWVKHIDDQYTVDDYTIMNPKVLHPSPTIALLLYITRQRAKGLAHGRITALTRLAFPICG